MSSSLLMDPSHLGRVPMRDHRAAGKDVPRLDARYVRYGYRYAGDRPDSPHPLLTADGKEPEGGDFQGALFWAHKPVGGDPPTSRQCGSWWENAAAAIGAGDAEVLPLYSRDVVGDPRYRPLDVLPRGEGAKPLPDPLAWDNRVREIHRRRIARGWPGIVLAGTQESSQELVFIPAGGALVSQWRGPDLSDYSSLIYDLTEGGSLGPSAQLDTWCRVSATTPAGSPKAEYTPAWNLTKAPNGGGFGAVYGRSLATGATSGDGGGSVVVGGGAVVGFVSAERDEFCMWHLGSGGPSDPFNLGVNKDGELLTPVRMSLRALFGPPGTDALTGPKRHDGMGPDAGPGPKFYRVFHWLDPASKEHIWVSTSQLAPPMEGSGGPVLTGGFSGAEGLATPNALCTTDQYGRPTATWLPGRDQRFVQQYVDTPLEPVTWHSQAFGQYGATLAARAPRFAAAAPTSSATRARRFLGGTGNGGQVDLPPELDVDDVRADQTATLPSYSTTYRALCRVALAICRQLDLSQGIPVDAWEVAQQSDSGLRTRYLDATGAADSSKVHTYDTVLALNSGKRAPITTYTGVGPHTLTAAQYTVAGDTSSNNITFTLPAANAGPREYRIANVGNAGNTVTIQRAGSDTIGHAAATSLALNDGQARVLVSNGAGAWYVFACC